MASFVAAFIPGLFKAQRERRELERIKAMVEAEEKKRKEQEKQNEAP